MRGEEQVLGAWKISSKDHVFIFLHSELVLKCYYIDSVIFSKYFSHKAYLFSLFSTQCDQGSQR